MKGMRRLMFRIGLVLVMTLSTACANKEVCKDNSKQALSDCESKAVKLQSQLNDLKIKLAQALANPGTIKVDPSVLVLTGPDAKKQKVAMREGNIKQSAVISVIRTGKAELQKCYNRALKRNSALHHSSLTLNLAFKVQPKGSASEISVRPNRDAKMVDCMKKAIKRWRFPSFSGQPVGVETPITLKPKG